MPFMSYHGDPIEALTNAGRLMKEGGAESVKLEGAMPEVCQIWRMAKLEPNETRASWADAAKRKREERREQRWGPSQLRLGTTIRGLVSSTSGRRS